MNVKDGVGRSPNALQPVLVLLLIRIQVLQDKKLYVFCKMGHKPPTHLQSPFEPSISITWWKWVFDQVRFKCTFQIPIVDAMKYILMRIFSRKLMFYKGKLLNIRQPNSHWIVFQIDHSNVGYADWQ